MPAVNPSTGAGPGAHLRALGLELPTVPKPLGNYVEVSQVGSLLFISGTLPVANGKLAITGRLGDNLSVEEGREAARLAAMNALAAVQEHVGDLDRVKKLVKVNIYMASDSAIHRSRRRGRWSFRSIRPALRQENGHARMVSGVVSLPKATPVVVETIFETT